jgi:hypothetical protein
MILLLIIGVNCNPSTLCTSNTSYNNSNPAGIVQPILLLLRFGVNRNPSTLCKSNGTRAVFNQSCTLQEARGAAYRAADEAGHQSAGACVFAGWGGGGGRRAGSVGGAWGGWGRGVGPGGSGPRPPSIHPDHPDPSPNAHARTVAPAAATSAQPPAQARHQPALVYDVA